MTTVHLCATLNWWLRPSVYALMIWAWLTGKEPSDKRIAWLIRKGVHISLNHQAPQLRPGHPPMDNEYFDAKYGERMNEKARREWEQSKP